MPRLCSRTVPQELAHEVSGRQAHKISGTRHCSIRRKATSLVECHCPVLQSKAFPRPLTSLLLVWRLQVQADIPTSDGRRCIRAALPRPAWTAALPGISQAQPLQTVHWLNLRVCQSRILRWALWPCAMLATELWVLLCASHLLSLRGLSVLASKARRCTH